MRNYHNYCTLQPKYNLFKVTWIGQIQYFVYSFYNPFIILWLNKIFHVYDIFNYYSIYMVSSSKLSIIERKRAWTRTVSTVKLPPKIEEEQILTHSMRPAWLWYQSQRLQVKKTTDQYPLRYKNHQQNISKLNSMEY